MNPRAKKSICLLLVAVLLFASGLLQRSLNRDRYNLGLTISAPLQDAPPVLALTTQALGGFRGLISNFLWIRSNDLQINDQYFEAAQLANWITDLEPHYAQVWVYEGWNMAYNISVKFKDFPDRWRWVENGIELLRDRGLKYNPDSVLIYQHLGWFFQHKMGQNLDDANVYYKTEWAKEMTPFFGPNGTNFDALLHPKTPQDHANLFILTNKYKIDPVFAEKLNEEWGPLDWRLPEAHAIYWASLGLEQAKLHPNKVAPNDLIMLRRIIYQSMMQTFDHGVIMDNPFTKNVEMGPNIPLIPKVNAAYESEMAQEPNSNISVGHRNFLCDATYYLYEQNDIADAQKWFNYIKEKYPNKTMLDKDPHSFPANLTLDEFAVARVQEDVGDTSHDATVAAVEGLLAHSYLALALGEDDRYVGFRNLAQKVYDTYQGKLLNYGNDRERTGLAPFSDYNKFVLDHLLDPAGPLPYDARAIIRSQLGMPSEAQSRAMGASTNSIPAASSSTNAPATNSIPR